MKDLKKYTLRDTNSLPLGLFINFFIKRENYEKTQHL